MARSLPVVSVVDAVVDDLRGRMLIGELGPGTPLTEAEVAATYDVARTTAKAAIESLVAERLLTRHAHKTARVVSLISTDVRDIYRTRELIEGQVLRILAADGTVPDAARRAHSELVALAEAPARELVEPDMRFHRALVDAIGSPRTGRAYAGLASEVMLCMSRVQGASLLAAELIVSEHEQIMKCIEHGDPDGAVRVLHGHLRRAEDRLVQLISDTDSKQANRLP